jgi:hypothetical protein
MKVREGTGNPLDFHLFILPVDSGVWQYFINCDAFLCYTEVATLPELQLVFWPK